MERSDNIKMNHKDKSNVLYDIYGLSDHLYTITLVPKGKRKSHDELLAEFHEQISKLKCVISYWLIKETTNTNHFHGVIQTKSPCKFFMFKSKNCIVKAYIDEYKPLFNHKWVNYCTKHNPISYYKWLR